MKYWIGIASRDHVKTGVAGGFCQLSHGKQAPVKRLSPGDKIVYYSPRAAMNAGVKVQAFTALGTIRPGEPYEGVMGAGFRPIRRDVDFDKTAKDAPIAPLLDKLSFIRGRGSWGFAFRRGSFEISAQDYAVIADAMGLPENS